MVAMTPPMGWNSWDCYGASVREDEVKANARYMSANLREFGWEYIVIDVRWYEPTADASAYRLAPLEMDPYGRLIPAINRFPSARDGRGFRPLADYIHGLGLKFGLHKRIWIYRAAISYGTFVDISIWTLSTNWL